MINVESSNICFNEKKYVFDFLFKQYFGIEYKIIVNEDLENIIIINYNREKILTNQKFLNSDYYSLLFKRKLPRLIPTTYDEKILKLPNLSLFHKKFTTIFDEKLDDENFNNVIPFDIIGGIFFLLTRFEEIIYGERDLHSRYPLRRSILNHNDLIMRPLVNEYIEIFWAFLIDKFPELKRKNRTFKLSISHDVDIPFKYYPLNVFKLLKKIIKSKGEYINEFYQIIKALSNSKFDPYNIFAWLADINNKNKLSATFNILVGDNGKYDKKNYIEYRRFINIYNTLNFNFQKIGFHSGYNTYMNSYLFKKQLSEFKQFLFNVKSGFPKGGRQHFLRFHNPTTWRLWEENSFEYDSTIGFPESVGFRCGICDEYIIYDLFKRKEMSLKERPLIFMDITLTSPNYMNLKIQEINKIKIKLFDIIQFYNGRFEMLFHNNWISENHQNKTFYNDLVQNYL